MIVSQVAKPLTCLTGKVDWSWGQDEQMVFDDLKKWITENVILIIPNDNGQFHVEADSSDYANGAVLSQKNDGKW